MNILNANSIHIRWGIFLPDIIFRQTIAVLLTIISLQSASGQPGYNTTFDTGVSIRFLSIESDDSSICINGFYRKTLTDYQSGFVASVDSMGQLNWWTEIKDDSSSITVANESGFSLSAMHYVAFPFGYFNRPSFGLAIIDPLGDIESLREYPQDSGSITSPRDIIEVGDGYLITGWTSKPPLYYTNGFVLKTDLT